MNTDISDFLNAWEYDSKNTIRKIKTEDGRELLQVRKPLGIEQYELDGRPDGKKPFGKEFVLTEYLDRLQRHLKLPGDEGFSISKDDYALLHEEAIFIYNRYLILFQIGDYERTVRDTEHNLKVCEFLESYYSDKEDGSRLLQYKPYILRMNAVSRSLICMKQHMNELARSILEDALNEIQNMQEINNMTFQFEKMRSLNYIKAMLDEISDNKKITMVDSLKMELDNAIKIENYEKAAELRDQIRRLAKNSEAATE